MDILSVDFDTSLYPLEAVMLATSRLADEWHISIERKEKSIVRVALKPKKELPKEFLLDELRSILEDMVLLDSVRYQVSLRTTTLRELILGRALYESCIRIE